jgi:hypothetical protein
MSGPMRVGNRCGARVHERRAQGEASFQRRIPREGRRPRRTRPHDARIGGGLTAEEAALILGRDDEPRFIDQRGIGARDHRQLRPRRRSAIRESTVSIAEMNALTDTVTLSFVMSVSRVGESPLMLQVNLPPSSSTLSSVPPRARPAAASLVRSCGTAGHSRIGYAARCLPHQVAEGTPSAESEWRERRRGDGRTQNWGLTPAPIQNVVRTRRRVGRARISELPKETSLFRPAARRRSP